MLEWTRKKVLLRHGVAHHMQILGPCYQLVANLWLVSVPSFSDLRTRYPRRYQYRRAVPAFPSEASTEVERIGDILDEAEQGDMIENQLNDKPPLSGQCSPFESLVQPSYTQWDPSQFKQPASAFQQPPAISLPPPSGCTITPRLPSRVLRKTFASCWTYHPQQDNGG